MEQKEICRLSKYVSVTSHFVVDSKTKRFIVCDKYDNTFHVFDFEGKLLNTFGRKGQGPGEYDRIMKIKKIKDVLYIYDDGLRRISLVNINEGSFIRSFRVENDLGRIKDCDFYLDENKLRIVFTGFTYKKKSRENIYNSILNDEVIYVFDEENNLLKSFGERMKLQKWQPFKQMLSGGGIKVYKDGFYFTQWFPYKIVKYSLNGERINFFEDLKKLNEPDYEVTHGGLGRRFGGSEGSFRIYVKENYIINQYNKMGKDRNSGRIQIDIFDKNLNYLLTHKFKPWEGGIYITFIATDDNEKDDIYYLSEEAEKEEVVFGRYFIKNK